MAESRRKTTAKKNVKKAATVAKNKRTISKLPPKVKSALGKKGAAAAKKKREG